MNKACKDLTCSNPECLCDEKCDGNCFSTKINRQNGYFSINIPYFIFDKTREEIDKEAIRTFEYLRLNYRDYRKINIRD